MSQGVATTASGAQGGDGRPDLPQLAKELIALVDRVAVESEAGGALVDEVVEAFHRAGLWGMWVPEELGGAELEPVHAVQVLERISYGDASAGWVLMAVAIATGADAAYLGDEAVDQLYPGGRLVLHAGQGTRPARAVRVDGGYLLSGEWSFASGIKHAQVVHTNSAVEGTGEARICVLPIERVTLVDHWDVIGLRATGSNDYAIDSVFVPDAFTYPASADVPRRGGGLYTLGVINFAMIGHSAWALGVGRRMLDELRSLVESRSGRPGSLGESDAFLGDFATAEGRYRAARALVYETWNDVQDALRRGDPLSLDEITRTRLTLQHTTWTIEEIARFVYTAAGTTALRASTLQRCFRDMHSGTQHVTSSPPVRQACGRVLAGLAPDKRWEFIHLIDA